MSLQAEFECLFVSFVLLVRAPKTYWTLIETLIYTTAKSASHNECVDECNHLV